MSLTVTFYDFQKRTNSTAIPSGSGTDFSVVLKNATSYAAPRFLLSATGGFSYNYADWGGWKYFVTDVISVGNERFEVVCRIDALGTLREYIKATTAFVLYDQTPNTEIPDTRLSTKTTRGIASSTAQFNSLGQQGSPSNGMVVLGITSEDGVSFFAVSQTTAQTLLTLVNDTTLPNLFSTITVGPIEDVMSQFGNNLSKFFQKFLSAGKAASCITSAKQLPLTLGAAYGNSQSITLGQFPTNKTGIEIERRVYVDTLTISIPWQFSDWRRRAPYTELYLFCPYFGMVALPTENLIGETSITIEASIDLPTGQSIFEVFGTTTNHYIGTYSANLAGEYSVGVAGVNASTVATSIIGATVAGAAIIAGGGAAAGMAARLGAAAVAGIIGGNTPSASTVSGGGGGASLGLRAASYIFCVTHDTTVLPDSVAGVIGTPAMESKSLGALTGFVQTRAASVSAPFYQSIIDEANSLLDGGVFIE